MRYLIALLLLASCGKSEHVEPASERRFDPMSGASGQVIQVAQSDFAITWDTTWNCAQTLLTWNNYNAPRYYVLFEGTGNGSCSMNYNVGGVTYYYPWTANTENRIALLSGNVCGTMPVNNYNIIVRYYEFRQGKWYEYNSLPVNIWIGTNICN